MRDVRLEIPAPLRSFLSSSIRDAGGNEVFFLGKLNWLEDGRTRVALLEEADVVGRGNRRMVPAIIPRAKGWDIALHNHPSGRLEPSDADVEVAALFGNEGVAFAIISNDASEHYLVTAPLPPGAPVPIDPEEVRAIFSPDGLLARSLEGFESRPGQVELAVEVARALNADRLVASEAGPSSGPSPTGSESSYRRARSTSRSSSSRRTSPSSSASSR
jgi:ATP-dependent DNA helicase DinG